MRVPGWVVSGLSVLWAPLRQRMAWLPMTVLAIGLLLFNLVAILARAVLAPEPYARPHELFAVHQENPEAGLSAWPLSVGRSLDLETELRASGILLGTGRVVDWTVGEGLVAERVSGARVSAGAFDVLRPVALRGRLLGPGDFAPEAEDVVVLTERLWRRIDPSEEQLDRQVRIEGRLRTLVGVVPDRVSWPRPETEFWVPFQPTPREMDRSALILRGVARVPSERDPSRVALDLQGWAQRLDLAYPDADRGYRVRLVPLAEDLRAGGRTALASLAMGAILVLLLACINFAVLLLVRGAQEAHETAIRAALGAGPRRLASRIMALGMGLGAWGSVLGAAAAMCLSWTVRSTFASWLPRGVEWSAGGPEMLLGLLAGPVVGGLASLPAALAATRRGASSLGSTRGTAGTAGSRWLLLALLTAELAIAGVAVATAWLLQASATNLERAPLGIEPAGVILFEMSLGSLRGGEPSASALQYYRTLLDRLGESSAVASASWSNRSPVASPGGATQYSVEGFEPPRGKEPAADLRVVEPGYFSTLRAAVQGREFERRDELGAIDVLLVNRAFVRRHFGDASGIGRRVRLSNERTRPRTIVGVVPDIPLGDLDRPATPAIYVPLAQAADLYLRQGTILVRASRDQAEAMREARRIFATFDSQQAPGRLRDLVSVVERARESRSRQARLMNAFSITTLILGLTGTFAVLASLASRREGDYWVRRVLGAPALRLARSIGADAFVASLLSAGLATAGLAVAASWLTRLLFAETIGPATLCAVFLGVLAWSLAISTLALAPVLRRRLRH